MGKPGVRIENVKAATNSGRCVCRADVILTLENPGKALVDLVTLHECELVNGDRGPFVGMPKRDWTGRDGTKKYTRLASVPPHTHDAILRALQVAWEEFNSGSADEMAAGFSEADARDPFEDQ